MLYIHLIVDPSLSDGHQQPADDYPIKEASPFESVEVPMGPSYLSTGDDGALRLSSERPDSGIPVWVVEPVMRSREIQLLILSNPFFGVPRINGSPVPPIAVAKIGDQIVIDHGFVFHVTAFQRPSIGSPTCEQIDKECGFCRLSISADATVFTCACGCVLHCESLDTPCDENDLTCAQAVSECPGCESPISLEEGYVCRPEL